MKHATIEKHSILMLVVILIVVSIGGIVQIAPLFWVEFDDREGEGDASLLAARTRRTQHLRAGRLLRLSQRR